jgi:ATP-dependent Clp protease protease subunit
MEKLFVIRFMAGVNQQSINALINTIESKLREGIKKIRVLISSPGGEVFWGISAYNYLKGCGAEIESFNFGSVDSVATVIYCAGSKRLCAPTARFLIHSVAWGGSGQFNFEEKQLKEHLKSLQIDRENIAKIIASNCQKTQEEIEKAMLEGTTFNPEQAREFGLVHDINENLLPKVYEIVGIG